MWIADIERNGHVSEPMRRFESVPNKLFSSYINKVPRDLRDVDQKAYTPQVLSIGPFHNGKRTLEAMEGYKWQYLKDYLNRDPLKDFEYYILNLSGMEVTVRQCYGEVIRMASDHFVQMLLLDGSFIVELILKFCMEYTKHRDDPIFSTRMLNAIMLDMSLLENQLPFFFLEHLFNLINGPDQRYGVSSFLPLVIKFYKCKVLGKNICHQTTGDVNHFIGLLGRGYVLPGKREAPQSEVVSFIPSATELQRAGVKFQKGNGDSFWDVKFATAGKLDGIFEIPSISIDNTSNIIIRNLIAHEQFDRGPDCVSQYIFLMDNLIKTADDVALLRDKEIIINSWLCDDRDLADLFNKLRVGVVIERESFYYARLFEDVNNYYMRPWNRWKAKLKSDCFNTPWFAPSFFAVLLLLICTVVRTVCTVLQYF